MLPNPWCKRNTLNPVCCLLFVEKVTEQQSNRSSQGTTFTVMLHDLSFCVWLAFLLIILGLLYAVLHLTYCRVLWFPFFFLSVHWMDKWNFPQFVFCILLSFFAVCVSLREQCMCTNTLGLDQKGCKGKVQLVLWLLVILHRANWHEP